MVETKELRSVNDLLLLRVEQAKLLRERVRGSCVIVMFIIAYTAAIMMVVQSPWVGLAWIGAGGTMVLVTLLYAKFRIPGPISSENAPQFLTGHSMVSAATGAVWSGFAIWNLDFDELFTLFIGCLTLSSITLGGVIPRSAFRPTYIALASATLLPFALFVSLSAPGAMRLVGVAMFGYFLFLMVVSAKVELDTRETIAAKTAHDLNEMILARNKVYKDANADKMRFMSGVAHDLSQPVTAQRFFVEGLRSKLDDPAQHELLDRIDECLQSQSSMLRGLTEISQLEHGNTQLHVDLVDLRELCEQAVQQARGMAPATLRFETDLVATQVTTDPILLGRIVRNLISNAIKFTPEDGRVELALAPHETGARVIVSDTGAGIAQDDLERIFMEFAQVGSNDQSAAGLGLGLSIVKRLCETLGIGIECQSELGKGTSFILDVPQDCEGAMEPLIDVSDLHPFEQNPIVLLADADTASREPIATALSSWNCQVIPAKSQSEALEAIDQSDLSPALMIVDSRIDTTSGAETITCIREEFNADIPAILIRDFHAERQPSGAQNKVLELSKPIDPKAIWLAMKEQLFSKSS